MLPWKWKNKIIEYLLGCSGVTIVRHQKLVASAPILWLSWRNHPEWFIYSLVSIRWYGWGGGVWYTAENFNTEDAVIFLMCRISCIWIVNFLCKERFIWADVGIAVSSSLTEVSYLNLFGGAGKNIAWFFLNTIVILLEY